MAQALGELVDVGRLEQARTFECTRPLRARFVHVTKAFCGFLRFLEHPVQLVQQRWLAQALLAAPWLRSTRITEGSRGMPLRFSLPLVPLSGSSGSCRLPHSMLTLGSFVRPIPILPRGLSCNSLAVLTLLPVPLSEKPAVKFHLLPGQLSSLLHGQQQALHFPLSFSHFFSLFFVFTVLAGQLWSLCPLPFSVTLWHIWELLPCPFRQPALCPVGAQLKAPLGMPVLRVPGVLEGRGRASQELRHWCCMRDAHSSSSPLAFRGSLFYRWR